MASNKNVLIYMDILTVELMVKSVKDLNLVDFESIQTCIKQVTALRGVVYTCHTCLKI